MIKEEKYLPIGSVVLLKGAQIKIMVTGFCLVDNNGEMYDYSGCPYPFGVVTTKETMMFNHDQIETLFCKGYVNDEEVLFKKQLNEMVSSGKIKEMMNAQNGSNSVNNAPTSPKSSEDQIEPKPDTSSNQTPAAPFGGIQ